MYSQACVYEEKLFFLQMIQQNTKVKPKAKSSQRGHWRQTSVFSITESNQRVAVFSERTLASDICFLNH